MNNVSSYLPLLVCLSPLPTPVLVPAKPNIFKVPRSCLLLCLDYNPLLPTLLLPPSLYTNCSLWLTSGLTSHITFSRKHSLTSTPTLKFELCVMSFHVLPGTLHSCNASLLSYLLGFVHYSTCYSTSASPTTGPQ